MGSGKPRMVGLSWNHQCTDDCGCPHLVSGWPLKTNTLNCVGCATRPPSMSANPAQIHRFLSARPSLLLFRGGVGAPISIPSGRKPVPLFELERRPFALRARNVRSHGSFVAGWVHGSQDYRPLWKRRVNYMLQQKIVRRSPSPRSQRVAMVCACQQSWRVGVV